MSAEPRRPAAAEHAPYYGAYIALVPDRPLLSTLAAELRETEALLRGLDDAQAQYRYAPGKWSVTDVVGHLADSERVFGYRALRFARGDTTPIPGFAENDYAAAAHYADRPLDDVLDEFAAVRAATLALFGGMEDACWGRSGTANGQAMTVRAAAYVIAGHERHHRGVLRERYRLGQAARA